ncbi:MAG: hypothetical protein V1772_02265 [Chloroflexota bacterium]
MPSRAWPPPAALDAVLRACVRILFDECQRDPRLWLSEGDLQGILYAILVQELPSHGIPPTAVHAGYACRLGHEARERLGRKRALLAADLALVIPSTIRLLPKRRWEADLAAALEVKRGCERLGELRADLEKLAAIRQAQSGAQAYMILMGHRSRPEDLAAVARVAEGLGIPLLCDNYWGASEIPAAQPELV